MSGMVRVDADGTGLWRALSKMVVKASGAILLAVAACFAVQAQTAIGGFYRQADQAPVMYQYTATAFCHVQNESQMAAYGGFSKVKVVPLLAMLGRQTGDCGWPDGFYRRSNEPAVYRLFDGAVCHVVNERQMAAFGGFKLVKVVMPTSDLARGRGGIAPCNVRAG